MKDGKRQFLTQNSERLVINWKTFIQSPPKIFQSVVRNVACRDRLAGMDTASFGNLQKSPEYFRRCSKVVEISFGNADNMHTKVSLLWLSCVSRVFRNEKGILSEKIDPRLFLGLLLGSCRSTIGQSFSLSLVTIPELFATVNSAEFPYSFVSPV